MSEVKTGKMKTYKINVTGADIMEQTDFEMLENAGCYYGSGEMFQREDPKFVANYFRKLAAKLQTERKWKV